MASKGQPVTREARYPVSVQLDDLRMRRIEDLLGDQTGETTSDILREGIDLVWKKRRGVPA
jgi:hypothetical protein